jgi:hypothetical protein
MRHDQDDPRQPSRDQRQAADAGARKQARGDEYRRDRQGYQVWLDESAGWKKERRKQAEAGSVRKRLESRR